MDNPERPEAKIADFSDRYRVDFLQFSRTNTANIVPALESFFIDRLSRNYVCVSNVHVAMECRKDEQLREIQNGSFLTIADGQPIILYGRLCGITGIERVMGPDIMTEVFSSPLSRGRRHFFLGGSPSTLSAMEGNLRARFPGIQIAGMFSPPFRALTSEEDEALKQRILTARPDYIWVCFGAPKQEYWMKRHHRSYPDSLLIGIGAGFAYHAGELKRAPKLAQKLALEWLWRLQQDPRRLWKRYLKTNPLFMLLFLRLLLKRVFREIKSILRP